MSKDKFDDQLEKDNVENIDDKMEVNDEVSDDIEEAEVIDGKLSEFEDEEDSFDGLEDQKPEKTKKQHKKSKSAYRMRYGLASTVLTIVVIAAVVIVNIIASLLNDRYPINLDVSKDKLYTLSENSIKLSTEMEKDVEIIVFMEEKTFSKGVGDVNFDKLLMEFYTKTKEYKSRSNGKISTKYVDPDSPTDMQKYDKTGVAAGSILIRSDKRDVVISIEDLYLYNQDQTTQATSFSSLVEQALVTNISKATSDKPALITILTGHKEDDSIVSNMQAVLKINGFDFTTLDITTAAQFEEESSIALLVGPSVDFTQEEKEKLRLWLNNDGKLDRQLVVLPAIGAKCPILYEFLKIEYGIEITSNIVEETEVSRVYSSNPLYTVADVADSDFTSKIAGNKVLIPSALQLIAHNEDSDQVAISNKVLTSMPKSAQLIDTNELEKNEDLTYEELTRFKADSYPIATTIVATKSTYDNDLEKAVETNVLVGSNLLMFNEEILKLKTYYNEELLISTFNELMGNEGVISTSNKPFDDAVLEITKEQYDVYRVIFQYVVPAGFLLAAIFVFIWRRRL